MRILIAAVFAAGVAVPTAACAQSAGTTRIETRPFYGAVVTMEHGVRVFRPLPPANRVIINPEGRTPLSLSFNNTRVIEKRQINSFSKIVDERRGGGGDFVGGGFIGNNIGNRQFGNRGFGGRGPGAGGRSLGIR